MATNWHALGHLGWMLLLLCVLTACTSIRPITKIGVVGPFEGLYRRNGYEALAAVRSAIEECAPPNQSVLPVALDDSDSPAAAQRAIHKLLADPAVQAIIGPLSPHTVQPVVNMPGLSSVHWIVPFMVNPNGNFVTSTNDTRWADDLLITVAEASRAQGAIRLVVVGATGVWQPVLEKLPAILANMPVESMSDPSALLAEIDGGDAILWLGSPHEGANFLAEVQVYHPQVSIWLGPQGGDPVLAEQYSPVPTGEILNDDEAVYWAFWTDDEYNQWAKSHVPDTPSAYQVYRAACVALQEITGSPSLSSNPWFIELRPIADVVRSQ